MSFFEDASLVLIPSGIKNQKIYSVKPTDGTGDLTFSRASNATRVASNGLIEKVRENLVPYSEEFDNAAWVKENITISPNTQTAPDGTLSADKVIVDNGAAFSGVSNYCRTAALTLTTGVVYTVSVYAKADGFDRMLIRMSTASNMGAGPTISVNVDLITGLQTGGTIGTYIGREAAANGYYRYIFQTTSIASATNYLSFVPSDATATEGNGVDGISIWGAMAEIGDVMTDYIATTTTAVSVGPVSGLPRLDYLNSSCPRLLLEPQRTNVIVFSEQFNNANWALTGTTVTANVIASPDGSTNADKLVENTSGGVHRAFATPSCSESTAYTTSVFVKKDQITSIEILETTLGGCVFDLNTGTITSGTNGFIEDYGNGWFRCGFTKTTAVGQTLFVLQIRLRKGGTTSYTGNGVDGLYLWGAQLEAGAYATSYIPTLSTSVTRVADAASKTGISSLIGQTEGTLFAEFNYEGVANTAIFERIIAVSDGTSNNRIVLLKNSTLGTLYFFVGSGGSIVINQTTIAGTSIVGAGINKVAVAYKSGEYAIYFNGASVFTSSASEVPATTAFFVGTDETGSVQPLGGGISQAIVFKTRLTNAQLAELTTL
jgi:hypothetical protein